MKWKTAFFFMVIAFVVVNCGKTKEFTVDRAKVFSPAEITSFHNELSVNVGWIPYADSKLVQTGNNEWTIVEVKGEKKSGSIPVLLVTYPNTNDTLIFDLDMKNELLGKLIKHSVMVQEQIKRPFTTFFEEAKCQKCHPQHIDVDFEN